MSIYVQTTAQSPLNVGSPLVLEGRAPSGEFSAVFQDDGETGYFYAVDPSDAHQPIQDALQIYDVHAVADRDIPSDVRIGWSSNSMAVLLAVNGNVHAVFHFGTKQSCCLSGFPPPDDRGWATDGHDWRDSMLEAFARDEP